MKFDNKVFLITGGTGSFGKMFIKLLLKHYNPKKVIVFSRDELKQFEMAQQAPYNDPRIRYFIGDVRDKDRLSLAFRDVDVVIHAAALKQVPACEYNPNEAIKTNIMGAQNVIAASLENNVERVVALSTDKACAPINLYGATKLCSDKLFIASNSYVGAKPTKFAVVRYGNVAGSRGSVIPFFKGLIDSGVKELPITDVRMTRFWLKLEDAIDMVFIAIKTMLGGELYVKKIPSMKITDLVEAMAPQLAIKEVGIRPGEKIHEMMITREDAMYTLEYRNFYLIQPAFNWWGERSKHKDGKPVAIDFDYNSGTNSEWLSVDQMKQLIKEI